MGVKGAGRLLLVSNRLPASVRVEGGRGIVVPSAGGLATGLSGPHRASGGLWFGWPGDLRKVRKQWRRPLERELAARSLRPIHLKPQEVEGYYHGFSNGVLWPLFHYLLDRLPLDPSAWERYRAVNQKFADLIAAEWREGDAVWVHDFHLALLPGMLRERLPHARIGFFLHVPFPASEVYRILPWRAAILRGILGADVVGFHTIAYLRHFMTSVLRVLGIEGHIDRIDVDGRAVHVGVYPMGVDVEFFERVARGAETRAEAEQVRASAGAAQLILGVDRLDYTKGLRRRLLAFERLLERERGLAGKVHLLQIAVPSREELRAYEEFTGAVHELVGRINGRFGTARWTPIRYLHRGFSQAELVALYRAADVLAVTPLRDGMNLVAKEFVASRSDHRGVLVLSEFAGASAELSQALLVNPYDVDGTAAVLARALRMAPAEQAERMRTLRSVVRGHDVHAWAARFLGDLWRAAPHRARGRPRRPPVADWSRRVRRGRLVLLLDYDGTLVDLAARPELAAPDAALIDLLGRLARRPRTEVHLVSGRDRRTLERWFGGLPIALHAEHGAVGRLGPRRAWQVHAPSMAEWKSKARPLLRAFVRNTPGALVEEKAHGIACHYRQADRVFAEAQARELYVHLLGMFSNAPVQVLQGACVLEVRSQFANKGRVAERVLARGDRRATHVLAAGDDATDEDLFAALPGSAWTVKVGAGDSRARHLVANPTELRALLGELVACASSSDAPDASSSRKRFQGNTRTPSATKGRAPQ